MGAPRIREISWNKLSMEEDALLDFSKIVAESFWTGRESSISGKQMDDVISWISSTSGKKERYKASLLLSSNVRACIVAFANRDFFGSEISVKDEVNVCKRNENMHTAKFVWNEGGAAAAAAAGPLLMGTVEIDYAKKTIHTTPRKNVEDVLREACDSMGYTLEVRNVSLIYDKVVVRNFDEGQVRSLFLFAACCRISLCMYVSSM